MVVGGAPGVDVMVGDRASAEEGWSGWVWSVTAALVSKNVNEPPGQLNPITGNLQLGVKESFATGCCWLWLEKKHKNEKKP